MLEILVHLEVDQEDLPDTLQLLKIALPDSVSVAEPLALEAGWQSDIQETKGLGDGFLRAGTALLLPVPSAIMPHTENYLFNPMHPDSATAVITPEVFSLDHRLLKR